MTKEQKLELLKQFTHGTITRQELWEGFFEQGCKLVLWDELPPHGAYRSNNLVRSKAEIYHMQRPGECNILIYSQETAETESKKRGLPVMVNNWFSMDIEQN